MENKRREASQKKKSVAFKVTPTISDDDEEFEQEDNEELSLLVKKVRRMFHRRRRFNNRKGRWQGKEEGRGNEIDPYYNCKKPDYLIVDFPDMKCKVSTSKKPYKKKTMKVAWDSESESEEEINTCGGDFSS